MSKDAGVCGTDASGVMDNTMYANESDTQESAVSNHKTTDTCLTCPSDEIGEHVICTRCALDYLRSRRII